MKERGKMMSLYIQSKGISLTSEASKRHKVLKTHIIKLNTRLLRLAGAIQLRGIPGLVP